MNDSITRKPNLTWKKTFQQFFSLFSQAKLIGLIGVGLFLLLGIMRLTVIGQFIDDVFFRILFGWIRWIVYPFLFLILFNWIFHWKWIAKCRQWNRKKILWLGLNFYWLWGFITGFILIATEEKSFLAYSSYNFELFVVYFEKWKMSSVFAIADFDISKFFAWNGQFAELNDGGGALALIFVVVSGYIYILVAIFFHLCSWIFFIIYLFYDNPFMFFLSKEQRERKKWKKINKDEKTRFVPRVGIRERSEDYTMELPTREKIFHQEQANSKKSEIFWKQNDNPKNLTNSEIRESNWEIPEVQTEKQRANTEPHYQAKSWKNAPEENKNFLFPEYEQDNEIKPDDAEITLISQTNPKIVYQLPPADLFQNNTPKDEVKIRENHITALKNKQKIINIFEQYNVAGTVKNFYVGPNITKYEIELEKNVRVQRILELDRELQLEFGTKRLRIQAPIPGKSAVGIEIPNLHSTSVPWNSLLLKLNSEPNTLKLGIGKNIMNETEILHLEKLPHLLVAGQTGGGKSVCLAVLIASLLYQKTPQELKLLLIDPKRVELSVFKDIPHLLGPVITRTEMVTLALDKIIKEIENRYRRLEKMGLKNILDFNEKHPETPMSAIVVIVDELADLILTYRKEIEGKIVKICQIARAVGVYLIVATQRPSSDIITGLIKTNIPGRIAFNVTNHIDSRTILNTSGAEKLLGRGDLLFNKPGNAELQRAQGAFLQEQEIQNLTNFWKQQVKGEFYWKDFANLEKEFYETRKQHSKNEEENPMTDELYEEVKTYVQSLKQVSVSLLQRRFNIGFNRAANMFEQLEQEGIISAAEGNKPREVIRSNKQPEH